MVEDSDLSGGIVYTIVGSLGKGDATCGDHHGALGNIVGAQGDDVGLGAAVLSLENVLVFFGNLLGNGLGGVVELCEGIFLRCLCCHTMLHEVVVHIAAEGLGNREEDTAIGDGIAFHIVEIAVGVGFVVVVETVGAQVLDDGLPLDLLLGDIAEVDAGGVALIFHVEAELFLLDRRGEVVDVLHHQRPVALRGVVARILQGFDKECLRGVGDIAGELADLIGTSSVGIFIGHGQDLVALQRRLQRDISQGCVDGILRAAEEPCALQLLIVAATIEASTVEDGIGLVDVAGCAVSVRHGLILGIGAIGRDGCSRCGPT